MFPLIFHGTLDEFYTRTARFYDLGVKLLPVWKTWLKQALPYIQGQRVLEVSFGTGYLLMQYANKFETHGVDINGRMMAVAKRNLENNGTRAVLRQGNVAFHRSWSCRYAANDSSWACPLRMPWRLCLRPANRQRRPSLGVPGRSR